MSELVDIEAFGLDDGAEAAGSGIRARTARVFGPRGFGYAAGLCRMLSQARIDLLHLHGIWMYPSVACIRWAKRGPYVISPHGSLEAWALRRSAWKKRIASVVYEKQGLQGAACLHALNGAELGSIRAFGLRNSVCVIPNGVVLPRLNEICADDPPLSRSRLEGGRRLVFLGRLHPKKGLSALLRAWGGVRPMAWRLVVAGWGQGGHEGELKSLVVQLGISDTVEFVGPKFGAEKDELLRRADAFVLPSFSEGLPVAVLEAWSYGVPVLMTPECNLPDGFAIGAALRLVHDGDGLAGGLEELVGMSEDQRKAMGMRGRKLVEERYTWGPIAEQMVQVYEWVLGRGQKPGCVVD